jgi:hypothetical protein
MEPVVCERRIDPPIQIDDVPAMEARAAWCLQQHRVSHVTSLLSLDGRLLLCVFDAPDTESVRTVHRQVGAPFERLWPATVHAPPSLPAHASLATKDGALVVVERCFAEPTDFMTIQAIENRGSWCLDQHRVRFVRTYFATDCRRMICLYQAPDAESVRRAQVQADLPHEGVWAAALYEARVPQG